jgi:hypothetical protein
MVRKHGYVSSKPFLLIISTALFTVSHVELREASSKNAFQIDSAAFSLDICLEGPVRVSKTYHEIGYSHSAPGKFRTPPDTMKAPTISKLRIFENGIELGPAHSLHADVRNFGRGRFSHWRGSDGSVSLYFSASDNTDPKTNGRMYTYRIDSESTLPPTTTPAPTTAPTSSAIPSATTTPPPTATPPPTSTGRVFYVSPNGSDSSPGTLTAPWRTIGTAALKLAEGDTAIVLAGIYEEDSIRFANSGTPGSPITIRAQHKWGAILSSTSGCNPAFNIYTSYITLEDIRIAVSPRNPACATSPTSANASVRAWGDLATVGNPTTGVVGFTARGLLIDAGRDVGIKINQDYSLVENCEIHNSLETFNDFGNVLRNNVLYGVDAWGSTITTKGGTRDVQVYNNVIHLTSPVRWIDGLLLGGTSGAQWDYEPAKGVECYNCAAWNNVVINETGTTHPVFVMAGCQDCVMANNVGIGGSFELRGGGGALKASVNPTWKNNILVCNGAPALSKWVAISGTVTVDHNDFVNCTGVPTQTHAIIGDPKFVNPSSDWHLQTGSAACGTGVEVNVPGYNGQSIDVSRDRNGNIRTAPWNLGIY